MEKKKAKFNIYSYTCNRQKKKIKELDDNEEKVESKEKYFMFVL